MMRWTLWPGCERGNRAILYDPHLDVIAIDAYKLMLLGN
jgi:hypothetical protein